MCLTDREVILLIENRLPGSEQRRVSSHLDTCGECLALVAEAALTTRSPLLLGALLQEPLE